MYRDSSSGGGASVIAFIVFAIIVILWMPVAGAMTDDAKPINLMVKLGFSNVEILSKDVLFIGLKGCSESDTALYQVQGINPAGQTVVMDVCAGIFKGATPRG